MTERSQRRAAERKARKAELKKLRNQSPLALAAQESPNTESGINEVATTKMLSTARTTKTPTKNIATLLAAANRAVDRLESIHSQATAFQPAFQSDPEITPGQTTISEAQLLANRANALRSTGPKSDTGKSIAAQNNFRHGLTQTESTFKLLASESKEEYAQLLTGYQSEWQPATETEDTLVTRLANHEWLRRRALNLQNHFLDQQTGLIADTSNFNLYRRYEVQHERAFNKALSDLLRIRAARIREQNGFESQARKNEKHEYQMRHLKHRESLHRFNEMTAQCRMTLAQSKLIGVKLADGPALRCTCEPGTPGCCPDSIR